MSTTPTPASRALPGRWPLACPARARMRPTNTLSPPMSRRWRTARATALNANLLAPRRSGGKTLGTVPILRRSTVLISTEGLSAQSSRPATTTRGLKRRSNNGPATSTVTSDLTPRTTPTGLPDLGTTERASMRQMCAFSERAERQIRSCLAPQYEAMASMTGAPEAPGRTISSTVRFP
jgi:hypothetical protein